MTTRLILLLASLGLATAALQAAPGRPMTIDDLITAVRVSEPALSPDGRLVAYTRTTTDGKSGRRNADIWVVAADGATPPRLLIGGDSSETTAVWSPDGKRIAFLSSRAGAPQVFVATAEGANPQQVTKLAAGAQPPFVWSPDGQRIAFVSDVYPECGDEACNARKADEAAKNPVKAHKVTRLLYRHWSEWRENIRHHIFVTEIATGETRDLTPGDFDSPPYFYEDSALAFSPDSRQIALVSNRDGNDVEAWSTNQDVWIVPISGGQARRLTSNKAADVEPKWTPDGRSIVLRGQRRPGFESDRWYLDIYDVANGTRSTVFESPDLSVDHFVFGPDGKLIIFLAQERATQNVYAVPFPKGAPQLVTRGGAFTGLAAGRDFVILARSGFTQPYDIVRASLTGNQVTQLTRENDSWLRDVAFTPVESLTVNGAGGVPIQYWMIKPPHFDPAKKYPTVFVIHGGPQVALIDAWSTRWNLALWAAQGWVVVAPNPRGSPGFGQKFVDEISQDWGGKVMTDLDAVFTTVEKMPFVDAQRMGIAGASYGGYAVNWIIGHTDKFKAAVSHDGVFNLESMMLSTEELWFTEWEMGGPPFSAAARENVAKWSPHRFAPRMKTPTLIITNELDYRVPVDQGLQMFTALRRQGTPSEMIVFPDEGHWVLKALNSRYWHEQVFGWLRRWMEGAPAR